MTNIEVFRKYPYPVKLTKEQLNRIVKLRKIVVAWEEYKISEEIREHLDDPLNLYRHLCHFWKGDMSKCTKVFHNAIKWRNEFKPQLCYKKPQFLNYMKKYRQQNLDICFFSGYCKKGNPVGYIFANEERNVLPRDSGRMDFFFDLTCFMMEDFSERLLKKRKHQMTFVVDAKNIGVSHLTLVHPLIKKFLDVSDYYYERLDTAYVVNAGKLIMTMWKIATPFLYSSTVKKYNFCGDTSILKKVIDVDQIPERLGGKKKIIFRLGKHIEFVTGMKERKRDIEDGEEVEGEDESCT